MTDPFADAPLPWAHDSAGSITDAAGLSVGLNLRTAMSIDKARALAAEIVRRVNGYDELVQALEATQGTEGAHRARPVP
jgi:hypothetical protein